MNNVIINQNCVKNLRHRIYYFVLNPSKGVISICFPDFRDFTPYTKLKDHESSFDLPSILFILLKFYPALKFISKKEAIPPLGLIKVSAMPHESLEKKLVDMNVAELCTSDFPWAGYILISSMYIPKECVNKGNAILPGACCIDGCRRSPLPFMVFILKRFLVIDPKMPERITW